MIDKKRYWIRNKTKAELKMEFRYRAVVYRGKTRMSDKENSMAGADLELHGVEISRAGFLSLINRWNSNGLLGVPNGGPIYIYIALPV